MRILPIFAVVALAALLTASAAPRAQQTDKPAASDPAAEIPKMDAGLGPCTADFQINDASGKAVYAAKIHAMVRARAFGLSKNDLVMYSNYYGKAQITGLPEAPKKPVHFDITKDNLTAVVDFAPGKDCHPKYVVTLK